MQGSCLCGKIAFAFEGPLELAHHCHCGMCRKAHGADFATLAAAPAAGFRLLRGEEVLRRYASSPGTVRPFCGHCGSSLPHVDDERAYVHYGLVEGDPGAPPLGHIYAAFKAPWTVLDPGIPAYDAMPPGFDVPDVPPRPEPASPGVLRGSCLCGEVAYAVHGPVTGLRHCHCGRCRRGRAAAFATNLFAGADALHFLHGEDALASFKVPDAKFFTQAFCTTCGSPMPRVDRSRDLAVVPAGTLDDDPGRRPSGHIFVGSKAPWAVVADDLPQHDAYEAA